MDQIDKNQTEFLWGCKARSGKTYMAGYLIDQYAKKYKKCNVLIVTPIPSETMSQFSADLFEKFRNFINFTIFEIKKKEDIEEIEFTTNYNIVIMSKQRLDDYVFEKKITAIQELDFVIIDEHHFQGLTNKSENILKTYSSKNTKKVYLTATYNKTLQKGSVPMDCQFYWSIDDEMMFKNRNLTMLEEKYGSYKHIVDYMNFLDSYDSMPDLYLLTNRFKNEIFTKIKEKIGDSSYGFSTETLFSLNEKSKKFNYEQQVEQFLAYISGSNKEIDFPEDDYSIFRRIMNISLENDSRTTFSNENFTTQLWFLPYGIGMNIDSVSKALSEKIKNDLILKGFDVLIINSKKEYKLKNLRKEIQQREEDAKNGHNKENMKYRGLIILAGAQCVLGITLPLVDCVFLFTNTISCDRVYQMMFRCMTENKNKKMGFIVDFNSNRVINTFVGLGIYPKLSTIEKFKYLVKNRLIHLDPDYFESKENKKNIIEVLTEEWRNSILQDGMNSFKQYFQYDEFEISQEDQDLINKNFTISNITYKGNDISMDDDLQEIQDGKKIEKVTKEKLEETDSQKESIPEILNVSFTMDVLPRVTMLVNFLTLRYDEYELSELLKIIEKKETLQQIFNLQMSIWFCPKSNLTLIQKIISKYIEKNSEIYNKVYLLKDKMKSLIDEPEKLLQFIDSCLKPKDIEKKKYGEVFTPMSLVNEMLDKLDSYYQKEHKGRSIFTKKSYTWFDPANGMGNFTIAVYLRLMKGLEKRIPDVLARKKHILEKMLYTSELNTKNNFVYQQIMDINNEYKMNMYEGNSLELDAEKQWYVKKFDVIMGNPPYNEELTRVGAKPLYNKFIEKYIDKCNYLTYIVPSRWFAGGKGLDSFREMMLQRKDIVYIKHYESSKIIFGSDVIVEGGINYFLKDKEYIGECNYNDSMIQLNKYDILVDSKYYHLINKLEKYENISKKYLGRYFNIESNDKRLVDKKLNENYVKCYVSKQKGFEKYVDKNCINKDYKYIKVITAESNGKYKCFGNMFIGKLDEIHTGSYISFRMDSEIQAKSFLSYLKCRLPNFMLSLRKISQHINSDTCKWIPIVPLDREWNDEKVYQYFNLTNDEINLVKNTNITGYKG